MEEESWRRNHGGIIWGAIWEPSGSHLGAIWEAFGRHLGGIWGGLAGKELQEAPGAKSDTPLS